LGDMGQPGLQGDPGIDGLKGEKVQILK
jgi:hypothetical protein